MTYQSLGVRPTYSNTFNYPQFCLPYGGEPQRPVKGVYEALLSHMNLKVEFFFKFQPK